ncbi:bifunctional enoyl-CoA hydratase/phosphate acetyltransferase, partial [Azospirillum sp. TSO22-1]|uniref:bifunctional enoyl-CoA hydratase/phosphate acetyltransferase n=1 Tax=Azospirillum sp. TSO22-1 TaxID=716789 RepID=UPI000D60D7FD
MKTTDNTPESVVENVTFGEIAIGQSASLTRQLTLTDVELFATLSGNIDPAHLDEKFAADSRFQKVIGHGMWSGSLISGVLGSVLPGAGTIYVSQDMQFRRPVGLGDVVTAVITVTEKRPDKQVVVFDCVCVNQNGEVVTTGIAKVIAPSNKVRRAAHELPQIQMIRHDKHDALLDKCKALPPVLTAVAHPCDGSSLRGAVEAAEAGLIEPILIGPEGKIRALAGLHGLDIDPYLIVNVKHSHAAAEAAVALAHSGEAEAVMKGSLHTDELMVEVVKKETGLRTGRRLSHVFVMNVPTYPRALLITDAAINIYPTLEDKVDIVQNAIDLA